MQPINIKEILLTKEKLLKLQDLKMVTMCTIIGKPSKEFKEIFNKQDNFYESLVYKHGLHELEFMIEEFYATYDMVRPINIWCPEEELEDCKDFCSISLFMCFNYSTDTIKGIIEAMLEEVYYYSPEVLTYSQAYYLVKNDELTIIPLMNHDIDV